MALVTISILDTDVEAGQYAFECRYARSTGDADDVTFAEMSGAYLSAIMETDDFRNAVIGYAAQMAAVREEEALIKITDVKTPLAA